MRGGARLVAALVLLAAVHIAEPARVLRAARRRDDPAALKPTAQDKPDGDEASASATPLTDSVHDKVQGATPKKEPAAADASKSDGDDAEAGDGASKPLADGETAVKYAFPRLDREVLTSVQAQKKFLAACTKKYGAAVEGLRCRSVIVPQLTKAARREAAEAEAEKEAQEQLQKDAEAAAKLAQGSGYNFTPLKSALEGSAKKMTDEEFKSMEPMVWDGFCEQLHASINCLADPISSCRNAPPPTAGKAECELGGFFDDERGMYFSKKQVDFMTDLCCKGPDGKDVYTKENGDHEELPLSFAPIHDPLSTLPGDGAEAEEQSQSLPGPSVHSANKAFKDAADALVAAHDPAEPPAPHKDSKKILSKPSKVAGDAVKEHLDAEKEEKKMLDDAENPVESAVDGVAAALSAAGNAALAKFVGVGSSTKSAASTAAESRKDDSPLVIVQFAGPKLSVDILQEMSAESMPDFLLPDGMVMFMSGRRTPGTNPFDKLCGCKQNSNTPCGPCKSSASAQPGKWQMVVTVLDGKE